ncbi:Arm DNA-binding domain-containing protein [Pantoea sp. RG18]|uniref:Arm DNA-binding domain-containing protein n=1 Tax=Pantoea sp. RG18 TaxID=2981603 RepID=UPI0039B39DF7
MYTLQTDTKLRKAPRQSRGYLQLVRTECQALHSRRRDIFLPLSLGGLTRQLSTGDYPSISLLQARKRRQQFRLWIAKGYDPRRHIVLNSLIKVIFTSG